VKPLIVGVAFMILLTFFNVFQVDQDTYIRSQTLVKKLADDAAAGGGLFFEETSYGSGLKIYDKLKSESMIKSLILKNMKLAPDRTPLQPNAWTGKVNYYCYYFDDSHKYFKYENGVFMSQENFSFNTLFTEPLTDYKKLITEPTIIVTIETAPPRNRTSWISWPNIIRSSAYEDLDRK